MFLIPRPTDSAHRLNRMFDEALRPWFTQDGTLVGSWLPAVDVFEEQDAVRIAVELPGVTPDDVQITVENKVLTIRGEKKQQAEGRTERVHRYERTYGAFERSFSVPDSVDTDSISARYDAGVLHLTLPKVEKAKPRSITVDVTKA